MGFLWGGAGIAVQTLILTLHIFYHNSFDYKLGLHCSHSPGVLGGFDHSVRQRRLIRGYPEEYPVSLSGEW